MQQSDRKKQWQRIQQQLSYTFRTSRFYQRVFQEHCVQVDCITSYEDFSKLPITTKEQLQQYNEDFISIPQEQIIDHVTTSGTLGEPVSYYLNEYDLERLAENESRSFKLAGITRQDKVLITTTLDRRFMAGMAYFLGLRKLGAGAIRTGGGLPGLQWESIFRFKPEYIIAVPSFLLKLIQYAEENQIDYQNSSIRSAICIGEPLRTSNFELNSLGQKISSLWDIELFSTYASTEMATAFTECYKHKGNHVPEDLIFTEVLDQDGNHVAAGEIGELIVTPLNVQSMPLIRFATGDMLTYTDTACECGRKGRRLGPVIGRKQQKIKLKGTSLYPQHIIEILNRFNGLQNFIIEVSLDKNGVDRLKILIPESFREIESLKEHLKAFLNVLPEIRLEDSKTLQYLKFPANSRKPKIFYDLR
ncbi:phenylacetate--CoA ligase family protein [Christiangramia sp. OXR-203]|uniref:phenylacetate--CoA ligase family protein n=1 Tax=Christiangramia sp. OXR-203 TaxID=3100176 RepID=UPI002AC9D56A|nr:AMP-binding protein [Christiangramia sp. OXR-203]WPY97101.1 AMP-binding protein [Christiangramia sp. OXR-203]